MMTDEPVNLDEHHRAGNLIQPVPGGALAILRRALVSEPVAPPHPLARRTLEAEMWKLVWLLPALLFGMSMLSRII
jgi:hypothetical protein